MRSYKGVLLVVSHDRAFMDNVVDRLLVSAWKGGWASPGSGGDDVWLLLQYGA